MLRGWTWTTWALGKGCFLSGSKLAFQASFIEGKKNHCSFSPSQFESPPILLALSTITRRNLLLLPFPHVSAYLVSGLLPACGILGFLPYSCQEHQQGHSRVRIRTLHKGTWGRDPAQALEGTAPTPKESCFFFNSSAQRSFSTICTKTLCVLAMTLSTAGFKLC